MKFTRNNKNAVLKSMGCFGQCNKARKRIKLPGLKK